MCSRNQHCFCHSCITQHLENAERCPTCNDELTVKTLAEPPRMVKDIINELNIHCVYNNRGCQEIVQLQHLDRHEDSCGFTPVVCSNEGCGATVNKRGLIHHESEQCEYRKLKCHSCGEMTITLANMDKKINTNIVTLERKMENLEKNMANIKTDLEGELREVNYEVKELKTALDKNFDQMKDVLVKMEDARKIRNTATGGKDKIFVAGGVRTNSVEIFNWSQKSWAPLRPMPTVRYGATTFVYNNHVVTAGGCRTGFTLVDNMIRMKIDSNPDLLGHWNDCPDKLPAKLVRHSSVVYNDHLYVTGGCIASLDQISDHIDEVQLVPPFSVKTLSRMPEPRQGHAMEMLDERLLIVGGSTSNNPKHNLSSVVQYNIKKKECKPAGTTAV